MKQSVMVLAVAVLWSVAANAQRVELPASSPKAMVMQRVGITDVTVEYSSPGVKDRAIWGELVPYDEMWRTGANASTKITFSHPVRVRASDVPAGTYAIFTIPGEKKWTVIISGSTETWGTRGYDEAKDAARVVVLPAKVAKRERMTFLLDDTTADSTTLALEWKETRIEVPVTTKTSALVIERGETYGKDAQASLARLAKYFMSEADDLERAIQYANAAVALDAGWYAFWIHASVSNKRGEHAAARASAQKAWNLGEKKPERFFYKKAVKKALAEWPQK